MGPCVVFVHGLLHDLAHLRDFPFPADRRALVLDLAGYGEHAATLPPATLDAQAEHVVAELDRHGVDRATLVGHSIGGAIAMLVAAANPARVAAVVNVEGNFTLADAFWSAAISAMSLAEYASIHEAMRRDPAAWLAEQSLAATERRLAWTRRMLDACPPIAVQALATAVVHATGDPAFLATVQHVLDAGIPVHLMAGERSRDAWHVPPDVVERAASSTIIAGAGHMMGLEDPERFLALVAAVVG